MMRTGVFDDDQLNGDAEAFVTSDEHKLLAKNVSEESLILLKNQNLALPIDVTKSK